MKPSKNKNKDKAKKERKQKQRMATLSGRILEQARKNADVALWVNAYIPGREGQCEIRDEAQRADEPCPIYPDVFPGELTLSCWIRKFPDNALENKAAATVLSCDMADPKSVQETSRLLEDLKEQGSVIAGNTLGIWHMDGTLSKDREKAVSFLSFAAGKGDPVSCYLLSVLLLENEADKEEGLIWLKRAYESKCPSAAAAMASYVQSKDITLTDDELCALGKLLAVYAMEGSWKCLKALLELVQGNEPQQSMEYIANVLDKLRDMAKAGFVPAILYMAQFHESGVFFKKSDKLASGLYKIAWDNGKSVMAGINYARIKFSELGSMTREEMDIQKEAVDILEACCEQKNCPSEGFGLLGSRLFLCAGKELYEHGSELLEKCMNMGDHKYLTRAASMTIKSHLSTEHRQEALHLLDKGVTQKVPEAIRLRALLYLHGILLPGASKDTEKGMNMLKEAAGLGDKEAYAALTEIYLFGLYDQPVDIQKAYDWAMDGVGEHHDCRCLIWAVLIGFKEFPGWNEEMSSFDESALRQMLILCMGFKDEIIFIFTVLNLLNATSSLNRLKKNGTSSRTVSATRVRSLGRAMGKVCIRLMQRCSMGVLFYMAQALGKIANTTSAERFSMAFSEEIGLPQAENCSMLQKRIQAFVTGMPESLEAFMDKGMGMEHGARPLPDFEQDVCEVLSDLRFLRN